MAIVDADLEVLDAYLDGALDAPEVSELTRRLAAEPDLAATLEELQSQRLQRQAVWHALEPDQATADRLTWQIRGRVAAELAPQSQAAAGGWRWRPWQVARIGSAAAACVVLGFSVGWVGRGHRVTGAFAPPVQVDSTSAMTSPEVVSNAVPMVPVADEYGRVVTFQPFKNTNDAKAFYEDLNRARGGGGAIGAPQDDKVRLIDTPAERPAEKF